ncbi:MAG: hypothetical protein V3W37_06950 [Candidatus Binatia bacterium]
MREIHISQITTAVRDLCIKANTHLGEDVLKAFAKAIRRLEVVEFPVIVVNDVRGNDLYKEGVERYALASFQFTSRYVSPTCQT